MRQQQVLEQMRQQQELVQELVLQQQVLVQELVLLFYRKRPKPAPTAQTCKGTYSWGVHLR